MNFIFSSSKKAGVKRCGCGLPCAIEAPSDHRGNASGPQSYRSAELVATIGKPCAHCGEPMAAATRDHTLGRGVYRYGRTLFG
jgi:hypothetical protein